MAMKAQEIINAAERKGLRYEINKLVEYSTFTRFEIGVNYKNDIWAWFTFNDTTDDYALFRNAYNMANGYNCKGVIRGIQIEEQLSR